MRGIALPRPRWGDAYTLGDLLSQTGGGSLAARDFALVTLAGHLSASFPGQLVFKGGFVLRHAHGIWRFSEDIDATRHAPPRKRLDPAAVAQVIRKASVRDIVRFTPEAPATDSENSLDLDKVRVRGSLIDDTEVQVEISFREDVVDDPVLVTIGYPYYEDFEVLAMTITEMAAEKLRCLAQRVKHTDLADLAEILIRKEVEDENVARLASFKFELVRKGIANRVGRIEEHIDAMAADYDPEVQTVFPGARSYQEARDIVWPRIKPLIP